MRLDVVDSRTAEIQQEVDVEMEDLNLRRKAREAGGGDEASPTDAAPAGEEGSLEVVPTGTEPAAAGGAVGAVGVLVPLDGDAVPGSDMLLAESANPDGAADVEMEDVNQPRKAGGADDAIATDPAPAGVVGSNKVVPAGTELVAADAVVVVPSGAEPVAAGGAVGAIGVLVPLGGDAVPSAKAKAPKTKKKKSKKSKSDSDDEDSTQYTTPIYNGVKATPAGTCEISESSVDAAPGHY